MTLSDTQRLVLSRAGRHEMRLAAAPTGLPAAARDAVFRSMLKNGLLAECAAPREYAGLAWREDADGARVALRITDAGLRAIGVEPDGGAAPDTATVADTAPATAPDAHPASEDVLPTEAAQDAPAAPDEAAHVEDPVLLNQASAAPAPPRSMNLRQAAHAVLAEPARAARGPREPREGTKRERVLALLRRPEGASGPQLAEATGWAPHTVRGFLAGLRKKGVTPTVLERVRQVGFGKAGAKGSHSVYRVAEAG